MFIVPKAFVCLIESTVFQLLDIAAADLAIMSSEADQLMKMSFIKTSSSTDRVRAISRLLFRLIDPEEAIHLLDANLSLEEKREVQDSLGQVCIPCVLDLLSQSGYFREKSLIWSICCLTCLDAQGFRLLIGQATGHYKLNLADLQHRDILSRLLQVNKDERGWLSIRYASDRGNCIC